MDDSSETTDSTTTGRDKDDRGKMRRRRGTGSFTRRGDRGLCLIILTEVLPSRSLRGNKNGETGESFARPNVVLVVVVERSCYFAGSLCRLQESPRVSTSFPFPSPSPSDRFRWIRADNWVSAIERTNRQGIEPRKRTSGKPGEYIFHFFTAPSSHPLLRPRSAIYLRSLSTSREHDRDVENEKTNREEEKGGGRRRRDHRWNERSLNREPDNSVLISLPQFFFSPSYLSFNSIL